MITKNFLQIAEAISENMISTENIEENKCYRKEKIDYVHYNKSEERY